MDSNNNNDFYSVNSQESDLYYSYNGTDTTPEYSTVHSPEVVPAYDVISKSFIFMFIALLITAFAAATTTPEVAFKLLSGNGFLGIFLLEMAIVLGGNFVLSMNKPIVAGVLYVIYSYVTGILCSVIFTLYLESSVVSIFLISAAIFLIMAIYGLVTDTDMSTWKTALSMGLIGLIVSAFVNLFILRSDTFDTILCTLGVLLFAILIAYDTKKMKARIQYATPETELSVALSCAFELYLDFINLFLRLIRIMGKKKR